jgi:hypothetical protein
MDCNNQGLRKYIAEFMAKRLAWWPWPRLTAPFLGAVLAVVSPS